ncbi:unnamed protein product [Camellia sinensis]
MEREVWICCYGVPFNLWSADNFMKIGRIWGEVLKVDDETVQLSSFSCGRVKIATKFMESINSSILVLSGDRRYPVRVCEEQVMVTKVVQEDCKCAIHDCHSSNKLEQMDGEHGTCDEEDDAEVAGDESHEGAVEDEVADDQRHEVSFSGANVSGGQKVDSFPSIVVESASKCGGNTKVAEIHEKHAEEDGMLAMQSVKGSSVDDEVEKLRSHIEMVKRFKVWTYKEGEQPLVHAGPFKDIYAIEGQFIAEMESETNPFMASHPDEAHAFFIPISVANIVDFVYMPITNYSRDQLQNVVSDYISVVANKYPYWNRSNGVDHFMDSCHDWWARCFSSGNPQFFKNFIRVLCNANTSESFQLGRDVPMPEVYGPAQRLASPNYGQPPNNRPILAFFTGGAHGGIREMLLDHWKGKDNEVIVHEYLPKGQNYTKLMGQSEFCLCPSGFEVASARVVEAIYAGCIPVIISNNYVLPLSDVFDWSQFLVSVSVDKIPEIMSILQTIPDWKYLKMQKRVRGLPRHFLLNRPLRPFDIIHMILHFSVSEEA